MSEEDVKYVISAVKEVIKQNKKELVVNQSHFIV